MQESPAVLSLGDLCEENGYSYEWHPGQPSYLIKNGRNIGCRTDNHMLLVVPSVKAADHKTKALCDRKQTRIVGDHELREETEFLEGLQPFTEGLTKGSSSSTDLSSVVEIPPAHTSSKPTLNNSGRKHNVITHFSKHPNCEVCRRTKVTRAPCRRNLDDLEDRLKIAERLGEMITADHNVLHEEQESRLHHSCAVVVQNLATQWIHSHPCKTKSAQELMRSLRKFLHPEENPRSMYADNSMEYFTGCEELNWNHEISTRRSETHGITERAARRVKESTSSVLVQSGLQASWWA